MLLRKIKGKIKRECIRNEVSRDEISVVSVKAKVEERQLRRLGRTENARFLQNEVYLEVKPVGGRPVGRPRMTFKEHMEALGKMRGDMRKTWRQMHQMDDKELS